MTTPHRLSCEQALRLLADYLDDELSDVERHDVHRHIDTCRSCYTRAEFERQLRVQLAAVARMPVRSEFEARVRALIGQFGSESSTSAS